MKTKIIIGAVLLVCAGAAAAMYYFKKKNEPQTRDIEKTPEESLTSSDVIETKAQDVADELESMKKDIVESISDRHQEAGQYIRETVNSILEGKRETKETKFDDKLNDILDKLDE